MGVLEKGGTQDDYKVVMDKENFLNRIKGYQELADRIQAVASTKNMNLSDITINKKLIVKETEKAVKTRIPGTWGENVRYLWINKANIMEIHNGKTLLTFLDKNKDYKLYDKENRVVDTMNGETLYSEHYDKVDAAVRQRYEPDKKKIPEAVKTITEKNVKKR